LQPHLPANPHSYRTIAGIGRVLALLDRVWIPCGGRRRASPGFDGRLILPAVYTNATRPRLAPTTGSTFTMLTFGWEDLELGAT